MTQISTIGALLGLAVAIIMIIKQIQPVYSLIFGAAVGGLLGGASLVESTSIMLDGAKSIVPAILRIITSGVLAGVLIKTGAASTIADAIINRLGKRHAFLALALSTMILTSVGVFIDIAVITVAPLALVIASRLQYSKIAVLVALIGGGKAGNIISPNPNTISVAENFHVELPKLMAANIVPALFGLAITVILAMIIAKAFKSDGQEIEENFEEKVEATTFLRAISAPVIAIFLLSLRPLFGINVDPLIALPVGGLFGVIIMGKLKNLNSYMTYGLAKMMPVAVLLLGTGAIAGIIKASALQSDTISLLNYLNMPLFLLAPISGILMSAATASTTSGATIASDTFSTAITNTGISPLGGAAMLHAGATVLDSLPHGSFFHATAGAMNMGIHNRLKIIPFEALVGLAMTIVSTIIFGVIL